MIKNCFASAVNFAILFDSLLRVEQTFFIPV